MKKLQNLVGIKTLSKKEQQEVKGGDCDGDRRGRCTADSDCFGKCLAGVCEGADWLMQEE